MSPSPLTYFSNPTIETHSKKRLTPDFLHHLRLRPMDHSSMAFTFTATHGPSIFPIATSMIHLAISRHMIQLPIASSMSAGASSAANPKIAHRPIEATKAAFQAQVEQNLLVVEGTWPQECVQLVGFEHQAQPHPGDTLEEILWETTHFGSSKAVFLSYTRLCSASL